MKQIPVITIDGPSGSGKGTISFLLAKKLGWNFLDSGAIYRVLAYAALQRKLKDTDRIQLCNLACDLPLRFETDLAHDKTIIWLGDDNVTDKIRDETIGVMASKIAVHQTVRDALMQRLRDFQHEPGLVADGRDMGTVVFPDAKYKFFLTASLEQRAIRRVKQIERTGGHVSYEEVLAEITTRDFRDKERTAAPMRPADDAIIIDTTGIHIDQVLEKVMDALQA